MKTSIRKFIHVLLVSALMGVGLLYFARNEEWMRHWLPFYGEWSGRTQAELLEVPVGPAPVVWPAGTANENGIPALMYHGILDQITPGDVSNTSTRTFRAQMKMIKDEGYTPIDTRDLAGFLAGKSGLPAKPILITFDDGRIDSVKNGDPILREFGLKAVMFVPVNKQNSGDKFFLSWDNLSDMMRSNRWDVQLHGGDRFHTSVVIDTQGTMEHFASNKEWLSGAGRLETDEEYAQRLAEDIRKGKRDLETHLPGIQLVAFAFPYGDYGQGAVNVEEALAVQKNHAAIDALFPISFGFVGSYAEGQDFNFFHYAGEDSHLIQRLDVKNTLSADQLRGLLNNYANRKLPFTVERFDERLMNDIIPVSGSVALRDGQLQLGVPAQEEGSVAIVTGIGYADYRFEADITLNAGQTAFLVSRYADLNNHLLCGVDGKDISFRQVVGGESILIGSVPYAGDAGKDYHIAIEAVGAMAGCSVNGVTIGRYHVAAALGMGSIGFKAWDPAPGRSAMTVRNFSVTQSRKVNFQYLTDPAAIAAAARPGAPEGELRILAPAWYRYDGTGNILLNEAEMNVITVKNDEERSWFPALGNRLDGTGPGDPAIIHSILASEANRAHAIDRTVTLALDRGFTGVSLDIANVADADQAAYADFLRRLADRLHEKHLVLVVDLTSRAGSAVRAAGIGREQVAPFVDLVVGSD